MGRVFKLRPSQPVVWFHRDPARSNKFCLYCGAQVGAGSKVRSNKEHLIGRHFVPVGSMNDGKAFNLIFRACSRCNSGKAELERHVSSVTLYDSLGRADPQVAKLAAEKAARDFHPGAKGTAVKDAHQRIRIESRTGPLKVSCEFTGPPQLVASAAETLAFCHIQGLFSLVTSADPTAATTTSLLPDRHFILHRIYRYSDWGNPELGELVRRSSDWAEPISITTAGGYFRARMRRGPRAKDGWLWALEWNKSLRLLGAIGDRDSPPALLKDLPDLGWRGYESSDGSVFRIRHEVPLDGRDCLFPS